MPTPTHRSGAYYDMIVPPDTAARPAGQWNSVRIIARGMDIEFWLNQVQTAAFTLGSDAWLELLAQSKFTDRPRYGTLRAGQIGFQDHNDKVWFRNIRIREINSEG